MLTAAILYILAAYPTPEQLCNKGSLAEDIRCQALSLCEVEYGENQIPGQDTYPIGYPLVGEACDYVKENNE